MATIEEISTWRGTGIQCAVVLYEPYRNVRANIIRFKLSKVGHRRYDVETLFKLKIASSLLSQKFSTVNVELVLRAGIPVMLREINELRELNEDTDKIVFLITCPGPKEIKVTRISRDDIAEEIGRQQPGIVTVLDLAGFRNQVLERLNAHLDRRPYV